MRRIGKGLGAPKLENPRKPKLFKKNILFWSFASFCTILGLAGPT
jgi:F0F1-type ATP synthase membrane subunit c/vacuolar-type H+-ATPase subunit K